MPNPVLTITPTNPAPGATVTVAVVYSPRVTTLTGTDQDGNVGTATLSVGQLGLVASPAHAITKVSDNGASAVFTFTA